MAIRRPLSCLTDDCLSFATDIRDSARRFTRKPALSAALLLTIALGIGTNVCVNGFAAGLTGGALPHTAIERVVSFFRHGLRGETGPLSYQNYLSLRALPIFEWTGAVRSMPRTVKIAGQSPILSVAAVTPDLADALNLSLDRGAVISDRLWQDEFRGEAGVGRERIVIDGIEAPVGGVAPKRLEGLYRDRAIDIWTPWRDNDVADKDGDDRRIWVVARLHRGVTIDRARASVRAAFGESSEIVVLPFTGMTPEVAASAGRVETLLDLAAGLVFLIACANVGSFLLGHASSRSREISIRIVLGAGRRQLIRGLFADSVVISIAGAAAGTLLAVWTWRVLPAFLFEHDAQRMIFVPDLPGILAECGVCVLVMIACGLPPAGIVSDHHPAAILKRESAGSSKALRRFRAALVAAQMTGCTVLVITTTYLIDGFRASLRTAAGNRLAQSVVATVYGRAGLGERYFRNVRRAAESVRAVSPIAWTSALPGDSSAWRSFRIDPARLPRRTIMMDRGVFTPDSLPLFKTPPVAGRLFNAADQTCRAAVVDERAARALFGKDSVGRSLFDPAGASVDIVGVLARQSSAKAAQSGRPEIYFQPASEPIASGKFSAAISSRLDRAELDLDIVSPSYFAAMGIPLVAGRLFPDEPSGCRVALINQQAADLYFNGNGIGDAVIDDQGNRTRVIGIVHPAPLTTFERRTEPVIYFPMAQDYASRMSLLIAARNTGGFVLDDLRRAIAAVPGRTSPPVVETIQTHLGETALAPLRIAMVIFAASAITALALSAIGLIGALNEAARQRRRELAIRLALGARRRHVIFEVLREGGTLACLGSLAGMFASFLLLPILDRITPIGGASTIAAWLATPLLLCGVVVVASIFPARRAVLKRPVSILRDEC